MWHSPSLQQLLFLEAVLEEGSLVRAAERTHTTHSTISRNLKTLSDGLGISLFDKTPHGLRLSNVGRVYGAQIRTSLEQARLAFDLARYEAALHQRPFYVGHSPEMHGDLLPVLEQISLPGTKAPQVVLKTSPTMRLVWRVLHGELQAGIGVLPIEEKSLWIERIANEPFSACMQERHRLASHSRLSARELLGETLVWIPRNSHRLFYDQVVNYLLTLKFNPRRFLEACTITQALDFATHGAGVALVPRSASRFQCPGMIFRPLTDDPLQIATALFVRRDQMRSLVKDFIAAVLSRTATLKLNPLHP